MIKKIIFCLMVSLFPFFSLAAITELKITTEPRIVNSGEVASMTVGAGENTDSTIYLEFESTSSTGQFSSDEDWSDVDIFYIRSGSANKNFYYKDSSEGNFIITVKATDKDGNPKDILPAIQTIIIGNVIDTNTSSTTITSSSTTQTVSQTTSSATSVHTSQTTITNAEIKAPAVGIGRKRLVAVGTAVSFEAWVENGSISSGNYSWSFGDGSAQVGEKVSHPYLFPGTYNVVLNASFNGKEAVSRTEVEVFIPEIKIKKVDAVAGYLELENTSSFETNLFGWYLNCATTTFSFPRDTIINAKNNLKIPLSLTGCEINNQNFILSNEDGKISTEYNRLSLLENTQDYELTISSIKKEIEFIAEGIAKLKKTIKVYSRKSCS